MRLTTAAPLVFALAACGLTAKSDPSKDSSKSDPGSADGGHDQPDAGSNVNPTSSAYDPAKDGFTVHEWGTLTSVIASDGTLLPGLHHEEEDLPGFVADRMAEGTAVPWTVDQKMETPVTYFYSPTPRQVSVQVAFPKGIFTQWFPLVQSMNPPTYQGSNGSIDPWIDTTATLSDSCRGRFEMEFAKTGFHDGKLDWGTVEVLAPHDSADLPSPLGKTTWGFARNTTSNPIRVTYNPNDPSAPKQTEKFLFYRGLGNFDPPMRVQFHPATGNDKFQEPSFSNEEKARVLGSVFLLAVDSESGTLFDLGDLQAGSTIGATVPRWIDQATGLHFATKEGREPLDAFVVTLGDRLAASLVKDGLYADEAKAMVDTWSHSWFRTPGVRLLYLLPQDDTNQLIPLTVTPAPAHLKRTMVIRAEIVMPEQEDLFVVWLKDLDKGDQQAQTAARAHFLGLGRFAEPMLTRALQLTANDAPVQAAGQKLLSEIRGTHRWAPAWAQ